MNKGPTPTRVKLKQPTSLMLQGTASHVGKTTLLAALGRIFARLDCYGQVAPFKPQNLTLQTYITEKGEEIARSQALQAKACMQVPTANFNPVVIKPVTDGMPELIINGKTIAQTQAKAFFLNQLGQDNFVTQAVLQAYQSLSQSYSLVLVEGSGSPVEINLPQSVTTNMGFAAAVDCPVVLVANIDKGGVFAQIVGTLELLTLAQRKRVVGIIINQLSGDALQLTEAIDWLEQHTSIKVLGVIPKLDNLQLDEEDLASELEQTKGKFKVQVLAYPNMNYQADFDGLKLHPEVDFELIHNSAKITADLLILPDTNSVRTDFTYLIKHGWDKQIKQHLRYGGKLLAVGAGYQMLGLEIEQIALQDEHSDTSKLASEQAVIEGLGLLPIISEIKPTKITRQLTAELSLNEQHILVSGFESRYGQSYALRKSIEPFIYQASAQEKSKDKQELNHKNIQLSDSYLSDDGQILGTYLHDWLSTSESISLLLAWCGLDNQIGLDLDLVRESELERLANVVEQQLDIAELCQQLNQWYSGEYNEQ